MIDCCSDYSCPTRPRLRTISDHWVPAPRAPEKDPDSRDTSVALVRAKHRHEIHHRSGCDVDCRGWRDDLDPCYPSVERAYRPWDYLPRNSHCRPTISCSTGPVLEQVPLACEIAWRDYEDSRATQRRMIPLLLIRHKLEEWNQDENDGRRASAMDNRMDCGGCQWLKGYTFEDDRRVFQEVVLIEVPHYWRDLLNPIGCVLQRNRTADTGSECSRNMDRSGSASLADLTDQNDLNRIIQECSHRSFWVQVVLTPRIVIGLSYPCSRNKHTGARE